MIYSHNAQQVMQIAQDLAARTGGLVCTEHLLYGLLAVDGSAAQRLLNQCGIYDKDVLSVFQPMPIRNNVQLSSRAFNAFSGAKDVAARIGSTAVGTEHILYTLLDETSSVAVQILRTFGIDPESLQRLAYSAIVQGGGAQPSMCGAGSKESVNDALAGYVSDFYGDGAQAERIQNSELDIAFSQSFGRNPEEKSADFDLSKFGTDLTQKAREGKLDPVIGRGKETERVIQVL